MIQLKLDEIFYQELGIKDEILFSVCLGAIEWTFKNETLIKEEQIEFEKENGIKHFSAISNPKNGLQKEIDKATGFDKVNEKIMYDYCVWFVKGFVDGFKNPEKYEKEF